MTPQEMLRGTVEQLQACQRESWEELIEYILSSLNCWLGYEVQPEGLGDAALTGTGFSLNILRAPANANSVCFWKGILGASVIEERLLVVLLVFVRSGDALLTNPEGKQFQEFFFEVHEDGESWQLNGWHHDIYGEHDFFTQ